MDNLVVLLLILVTIFICIELGTMICILVTMRKIGGNLNRLRTLVEQQAEPAISEVREILGEARGIAKTAREATENLTGITETVRSQVEHVNSVIEETTDRARLQISRADGVVTDAIKKMEDTSTIIQQSVLGPVRELAALIRGISGGLNFLFSRKRNPVNKAHQDEELFI